LQLSLPPHIMVSSCEYQWIPYPILFIHLDLCQQMPIFLHS
jgi:hypothetical protein